MRDAGFDGGTTTVDASSRESVHALVETATAHGDITGLVHAVGVSPSQAGSLLRIVLSRAPSRAS
jgi:enoyl-[acyl-carrier-protein] reductase (NADH)